MGEVSTIGVDIAKSVFHNLCTNWLKSADFHQQRSQGATADCRAGEISRLATGSVYRLKDFGAGTMMVAGVLGR